MSNFSEKSILISGLLWAGLGTIAAKSFSLISQFFLGHFLDVSTYGVFAIVVSSMVFVTVFQNTGVPKILMSNHDRYLALFPEYSAFIFISSLFGCSLLLAIGFWGIRFHEISGLMYVYFMTALSMPLLAVANLFSSKLSVEFRFKEINTVLAGHALVYYSLVVFLAWVGAEIYTIAIATLAAAGIQVFFFRKLTGKMPLRFKLKPRLYLAYIKEFRWILLTGFASALAMRADFLVLLNTLSITDLGYYYFGFMLVMSLASLISSGINRTLLPIFAKQANNSSAFQKHFFEVSTGIAVVSSCMSLLIIISGPYLMHFVWSGKWDGAAIVVIIAALFIPIRMMNTIAHTTLEAKGEWWARVCLSLFEIITLVVLVYTGASLGGLLGACAGTAVQRIISALVSFTFVCSRLNIKRTDILYFSVRAFLPFLLSISGYFYFEKTNIGVDNVEYIGFEVGSYVLHYFSVWMLLTFIFNYRFSISLLRRFNGRLK